MTAGLRVQGTVQRLVTGDGSARVEHRTRDLGAMFAETEWGWSADGHEAYVFAQFEEGSLPSHAYEISASSHAAKLKSDGESHAYPCVHGSEARQARETARASRAAGLEAQVREFRVTPEEAYARTQRLLGERD